ncbi:hypothetical protein QFC19_007966 [Naganishia cerealis]|uniref:Uncharacterized protein n=1 Tax=Naganishia cerealis TaxID=610337 RepID=A0ACC2V4S3_9TREE|nr:hypothetical protein QFC19_007966 [Naganishia cerealis]
MLGESGLPDRAVVGLMPRSGGMHNLALGSDTMGIDRNSIENDLWVNIVDVVILGFTIIGAGAILTSMMSRELKGRAATVRTRLVQGLVVSDFALGPDRIKASFSNSGRRNTSAQQSDPEYTYQSATSSMIAAREGRTTQPGLTKEKIVSQFAKFSFKKHNPDADAVELDEKKARSKNVGAASQPLIEARDFAGPPADGVEDQTDRSRSGSDQSKSSDIPPWEKLELPAFQIDGQRYGGSASSAGSSKPGSGWGELKPFGKKGGGSKRPTSAGSSKGGTRLAVQQAYPRDRVRSQTVTSNAGQTSSEEQITSRQADHSTVSKQEQTSSLFSTYEGMAPKTIVTAPSPQQHMEPFPAVPASDTEEEASPSTVFQNPRRHPGNLEIAPDQQLPARVQRGHQLNDLPAANSVSIAPEITTPTSSSSMRPLIDRTRQASVERSQLVSIRRDSAYGVSETDSRRGSGPVSFVLPPSHKEEKSDAGSEQAFRSSTLSSSEQAFEPRALNENIGGRTPTGTGGEAQTIGEDEDDGNGMDFAQMLAASYGDGEPTGSRQNRNGSDGTEFIQESTASYMNRKTAMLMLYFPLV